MKENTFVETYIIRLLAAFEEYGTLTKVGEALGVTQPPISRAMQKLEATLGVPLFERTKNKISLNKNGQFAASYAKKIMALQNELITKTREYAGLQKSFKVGSVAIQPAINVVKTAESLYDKIDAKYEIDDTENNLLRALTDDVYQMILLLHPIDDNIFKSQRYFSEKLYVMLPKTHRLSSKESLALSDLAGETFVVYNDVGFWEKIKKEKIPNAQFIKIVYGGETDSMATLIKSSNMPSFISDRTTAFTLPKDRVAIPLSDKEMSVTFYAIYKKEQYAIWAPLLSEMAKEE